MQATGMFKAFQRDFVDLFSIGHNQPRVHTMLHGQLSIIHLLYSYEILGESMAHVVSSPSGHETKVDANSTLLF